MVMIEEEKVRSLPTLLSWVQVSPKGPGNMYWIVNNNCILLSCNSSTSHKHTCAKVASLSLSLVIGSPHSTPPHRSLRPHRTPPHSSLRPHSTPSQSSLCPQSTPLYTSLTHLPQTHTQLTYTHAHMHTHTHIHIHTIPQTAQLSEQTVVGHITHTHMHKRCTTPEHSLMKEVTLTSQCCPTKTQVGEKPTSTLL